MKPLSYCLLGGWGSTDELWSETVQQAGLPGRAAEFADKAEARHLLSWLDCVQNWPAALATLASLPGPYILVGWSLGALLALRAALDLNQMDFNRAGIGIDHDRDHEMPGKIAAMVLISATPRMCADEGYGGVDPRVLAAMRKRVARNPQPVLEEFAGQCATPDGGQAARDAYLRQAGEFSAPELAAGLEALATLDLRERLGEIHIPCRLLHGSEDRIVPLQSAQFLASRLPRAQLEVLEGCGHALPFTHPARIAHCIASAAAETKPCGIAR